MLRPLGVFLRTPLLLSVIVSLALGSCSLPSQSDPVQSIEVLVPFTFTSSIDPRALVTVGDQVVSEHVFAFHSRESIKDGFGPVFSKVTISSSEKSVRIEPFRDVTRSDGANFDFVRICSALEGSLRGTRHAPYGSLVESIDCDTAARRMTVRLSAVPVNLREIFTLPDFAIFDPAELPISPERLAPTTGPYHIVSMDPRLVELRSNPHYPAELRANTVERVRLHSYPASETSREIRDLDPKRTHVAYFYGYALGTPDLQAIRDKGFVLETFPTEWLIYLAFGTRVTASERARLAEFIDSHRESWLESAALGQPAFSVAPSDRPFGLSREEYRAHVGRGAPGDFSRKLALGTLKSWHESPLFARVCADLLQAFPQLELKLHESFVELGKSDVILSPLGISQFDPLTHLAFLSETMAGFSRVVPAADVAKASVLVDSSQFNERVKEFERRILKERIIVPLAHFPGLVAHAPGFERDESLAYSWGIQAWAYRVR